MPMLDDTEPSASSSMVGPLRYKRTRTHARRSCLSCRQSKSKCSLPNLDVTSSMSPQKLELSCGRCKALGISCIVWDGDRKSKRYTQLGTSNGTTSASTSIGEVGASVNAGREHEAVRGQGIVSAFILCEPEFRGTEVSEHRVPEEEAAVLSAVSDSHRSRRFQNSSNAQVHDSDQGYVIRFAELRTRPMHLFCSLLAKHGRFNGALSDGNERLDILYEDVVRQIDATYRLDNQEEHLFALHCHLPCLKSLFKSQKQSRSMSTSLLTCLMVLLSPLNLHHAHVRHLVILIRHYGRQVLLYAPRCIEAAQSLELLAVHLPSILESTPDQNTQACSLDPDCPSLGAGLIGQAQQIVQYLSSQEFLNDGYGDGQYPSGRIDDLRLSLQTWSLSLQLQDRGVSDMSHCEQGVFDLQSETLEDDDARRRGRVALRLRARYVLDASKASVNLARVANDQTLSVQQYRVKQSEILTKLAESTDAGEQERRATQKMGLARHTRRFDSIWTWLDLESKCLLQISIARSITSILRKILARSSGRELGASDTKRPLVLETISTLWRDAEWADYVWKLAHQRRRIVVSFLARLSNFVSDGAVPMSITCFPMPSLCAWAVSAAFTLVDEYAVVLQLKRCKVEELDTHISLLHQCAGAFGSLSKHFSSPVMVGSLVQDFGNVKCTSLAIRAIATTLSTWQDKHTTFLSTVQVTNNASTHQTQNEANCHEEGSFTVNDLLAQGSDDPSFAEVEASFEVAPITCSSDSYSQKATSSMDWADVISLFLNGNDQSFQ